MEFELDTIDTRFNVQSVYSGMPSQELDDAWTELLNNFHIRVSAADLGRLNQSSISLSDDEGGYLAALGKKKEMQ